MKPDPGFESLVALYADLEERVRTIEQFIAVHDPYDPVDTTVDIYDPDGNYTYD